MFTLPLVRRPETRDTRATACSATCCRAGRRTTVEEYLRLDGPIVRGVSRFVATDTTLAGTPIAAGDIVIVSLALADRDPPSSTPRPARIGCAGPTAICSSASAPTAASEHRSRTTWPTRCSPHSLRFPPAPVRLLRLHQLHLDLDTLLPEPHRRERRHRRHHRVQRKDQHLRLQPHCHHRPRPDGRHPHRIHHRRRLRGCHRCGDHHQRVPGPDRVHHHARHHLHLRRLGTDHHGAVNPPGHRLGPATRVVGERVAPGASPPKAPAGPVFRGGDG